ncbi:hypothetical protein PI124_g24471 [Phytophthora idaei]|nr:hypothetical protein PI125_g27160 [Phytophthora idaei]KAG3125136.1 hypothetical protein PI126_g22913 [Phytophthora idaei]KAG3230431.1 hypothetical protein PI124_g24471 [Phytophthora idaei]
MTDTSLPLTKVSGVPLLKARTPVQTTANRVGTSQIASEASIKTVAVASEPSIRTVEVVTEASVKTLVVDVTSTATTGAHSMDLAQSAVG